MTAFAQKPVIARGRSPRSNPAENGSALNGSGVCLAGLLRGLPAAARNDCRHLEPVTVLKGSGVRPTGLLRARAGARNDCRYPEASHCEGAQPPKQSGGEWQRARRVQALAMTAGRHNSSYKPRHSGFIRSMSSTFFARDPVLICFSLVMAL